ncbi:putative ubiquitin interaction domain-containing protein [Rosellinia necatrix]|uniref:Putative ubiquitin interaction domain-containing protein n=1 Tax=Rosellinia necatrix TaxID=77044 RepID=A0A1S7UL49_ROSNE|nr:putative ubiquitin interaction domain-containing protein [Rosellinia necatrix]
MAHLEEPAESDASLLQDLFGISRAEAIKRLKANNNNVESATNEFLDDPTGNKYRWDESHFNTDREGETNQAGISFNIQAADELPPLSHVNSAAPTRPPSRADNRSPLGGPTNAIQEDADLARAIAESAAESGITPQEVGVVDHETNSKYFGPANRPEYDTAMWAMVPTKATVEAEATDPPASNRIRDIDAPAFLRQTKPHRAGSLISIYSKIPLARNFLLACGRPAPTYGHNTEWWKGNPILRQDVLTKIARGEDVWGEETHPDFIEELHRLVAFLDMSERSYASADSLAETKAIDESFGSWMPDIEERLFQALQDIGGDSPDCGIDRMITTGKIMPVMTSSPRQSEFDGQPEEEENTTSFIFLDLVLDYDTYSCVETLYDALDHLLWSSALSLDYTFPHDAKTAVLLEPAEVLTLRFGGGGLVKPCQIPAVFYADRYMNSRKELALHFQTQIREIKDALKNLAWSEEERVNCTGQFGCSDLLGFDHKHDVRECCAKMIAYAEHLLGRQKKDIQWRQFQDQWWKGTPYSMDDLRLIHTWSGPSDFTSDETIDREKWEYVIQVCKDRIEEAGRALTECEQQKEELNRHLEVVRKRLTCQEHEVEDDRFVFRSHNNAYRPEYWDPSTKYLLRGVATTSDVAYVCARDVEDSPNPNEHSTVKDQWWKIGYVKSDASPIKSEKVTIDDVIQAAGTECKNPIVVYASETALNQEPIPLSDALRMFVKADNRSFQQELAQEANLRETTSQNQDVAMQDRPALGVTAAALSRIPSGTRCKRKHSVGSSVATNGSIRSELADVELTFDDPQPAHGDVSSPAHQRNDSRSLKLGDVVESLAKCQTDECRATGYGDREGDGPPDGYSQGDGNESDTNTASTYKMPEMSERKGVMHLFLAGSTTSAQNPIDTMDLDPEPGHRGG